MGQAREARGAGKLRTHAHSPQRESHISPPHSALNHTTHDMYSPYTGVTPSITITVITESYTCGVGVLVNAQFDNGPSNLRMGCPI